MLELLASIIFIAPLAAALFIGIAMLSGYFQGELCERFAGTMSSSATLISLLAVISLLSYSLIKPDQLPASLTLLDWFSSGQISIQIAISLDFLA